MKHTIFRGKSVKTRKNCQEFKTNDELKSKLHKSLFAYIKEDKKKIPLYILLYDESCIDILSRLHISFFHNQLYCITGILKCRNSFQIQTSKWAHFSPVMVFSDLLRLSGNYLSSSPT